MKGIELMILLCSVLLAMTHPLWAEEAQPSLQLAPGSGMQQALPQVAPAPGLGAAPSMGEQLQLRDIHPPLPLPEEKSYAPLIAGLVILLLLLAVAFWFFRLRKKEVSQPFAHETALAALLRARSLMTPEQALGYADALSDILRRYIEARFRIRSTRQTTKEFLSCLTEHPTRTEALLKEHCDSLRECLGQCDMAKFARCTPDRSAMEKMEQAVQNFIESTRENGEGGR